jgi:hypothetical protein
VAGEYLRRRCRSRSERHLTRAQNLLIPWFCELVHRPPFRSGTTRTASPCARRGRSRVAPRRCSGIQDRCGRAGAWRRSPVIRERGCDWRDLIRAPSRSHPCVAAGRHIGGRARGLGGRHLSCGPANPATRRSGAALGGGFVLCARGPPRLGQDDRGLLDRLDKVSRAVLGNSLGYAVELGRTCDSRGTGYGHVPSPGRARNLHCMPYLRTG